MPHIVLHDPQLGECRLDYSWNWNRDPYPHYKARLSGYGRCEGGMIVDGGEGISFDSLLYRYGADHLGLQGMDPVVVRMTAKAAIELDCATHLAKISGDSHMLT